MRSRTVSLLLIGALIACPMWCGEGPCIAGLCGLTGEHEVRKESEINKGTTGCCKGCHKEQSDQQIPSDCSEFSCQGICGGAILEKTVDVIHASPFFSQPPNERPAPVRARLADCANDGPEPHCRGSDGNHGRFVRTLHMSFLC